MTVRRIVAESSARRQFQIRLDDALWQRLRALAARTPELSQSSHARIALSEYLTREEQK
jgi:predicted transcriptional regulator